MFHSYVKLPEGKYNEIIRSPKVDSHGVSDGSHPMVIMVSIPADRLDKPKEIKIGHTGHSHKNREFIKVAGSFQYYPDEVQKFGRGGSASASLGRCSEPQRRCRSRSMCDD